MGSHLAISQYLNVRHTCQYVYADSQQLQRLLLESIANGTVAAGRQTLPTLVGSTLLSHQARPFAMCPNRI